MTMIIFDLRGKVPSQTPYHRLCLAHVIAEGLERQLWLYMPNDLLQITHFKETKMAVLFATTIIQTMQLLLGTLNSYTGISQYYPKPANVEDLQGFDFVVVGAGSAGCVLANRLTEVTHWKVLLIEAGDFPTIMGDVPGLFPLMDSSPADWNYTSVYDRYSSQAVKAQVVHESRGMVVGGSSVSNYMVYNRGNKADFDHWVSQGNEGWDWDNVTHYYKLSERFRDSASLGSSAILHGTSGYLGVTRIFCDETKPYLEAFEETGHAIHADMNGYQQVGYAPYQYTIDNDLRQSTAVSFIRPIKDRPNLYVLTKSLATKVLIENKKACGVVVKLHNGKYVRLLARKEVILSAGAINSPQLLMLSGVGPKKHLEEMNIPVILDSPNVGENMQDHPIVSLLMNGKASKPSHTSNPVVDSFVFPGPSFVGHIALNRSQTYPDYQSNVFIFPAGALLPTVFCSHIFKLSDEMCDAIAKASISTETIYVHLSLLHPKSRGSIKLMTNNPLDKPLINLGYYSDPSDIDAHASYVQDFFNVLNSTYFKSLKSSIIDLKVGQCRHLDFASREYWRCFVLNTATTQYHVSGTCAMGREGEGVVDARLRVWGIQGMRIVDGSIIPTITSGNTNAPIIMIAEKASDMIKADHEVRCP